MKVERQLVIPSVMLIVMTILAAVTLLQRNEATKQSASRLALIQEARRLETKMNEDMQRVLSLQLHHYDSLVITVAELNDKAGVLVSSEFGLRGSVEGEEFNAALDNYHEAIVEKIRLIERIKLQVALLRNSLQYLPVLLAEYESEYSRELVSDIHSELLSALLEYNLFPSTVSHESLLEKIDDLRTQALFSDESQFHEHLLRHLNNNIDLRESITRLASLYQKQPSEMWLDHVYENFYVSSEKQSRLFYLTSITLFTVVVVLFVVLAVVVLSLYRARESAESTWQRMHDALESISEAFVLFDSDGRLALWNHKYTELFSADDRPLKIGTHVADLSEMRVKRCGVRDPDKVKQCVEQMLDHFHDVEHPRVEEHADGTYYLISNSHTSDAGTASIFVDITEQKKAEDQLLTAAVVFDATSEGIVVTDQDNRILAVNPSFSKITGYQPDEVVGKTPNILSSGRHSDAYYQGMWEKLQREGRWEGEIWNRNKKGEIYPEWLSLTVVRNDEGETVKHIAVFSDITRRKQDEEKIRWQANYDMITGLPNRTLFQERLHSSINSSHREGWTTALLFIDLDHFKSVNDTRGHEVGDWLLQEVAGRLASCIREADTVARMGGDEFTVILQDVGDARDTATVAQKIVDSIAEPFFAEGGDIFIGASVGITLYPNDSNNSEDLIRNADLAMYRAKETGRSRYSFFTQSMNQEMKARIELENAMRYALQRDEFSLVFQPIVDSSTGKVVKAESLIRWRHPERGNISPLDFVPIAEQSGLIASIGWWVIENACNAAADWMRRGLDVGVSINISAQQIRLGLNVEDIISLLNEIDLPAERVTLEITETLLLGHTEKVLGWLNRVRSTGLNLSVDDFGTGFSSLSYLKRFPVNSLKIDQSFVNDMTTNEEDAELVRAIISIAGTFELEVIAEGVENQEQLQFLNEHGCSLIQGYYYSHPVSSEKLFEYASREDEARCFAR